MCPDERERGKRRAIWPSSRCVIQENFNSVSAIGTRFVSTSLPTREKNMYDQRPALESTNRNVSCIGRKIFVRSIIDCIKKLDIPDAPRGEKLAGSGAN